MVSKNEHKLASIKLDLLPGRSHLEKLQVEKKTKRNEIVAMSFDSITAKLEAYKFAMDGYHAAHEKKMDAFQGISVKTMKHMVWYHWRHYIKFPFKCTSQLMPQEITHTKMGKMLRELGTHKFYENDDVKQLLGNHKVHTTNQKKYLMAKELGKVLGLEDDLEDAKPEDVKPKQADE